ncbi:MULTISPECIES: hypothetical protein [unclassified Roseibium]|uniref:hypothetical protein n=1 Tax=unclassified Roseibium TaxID=2629323 RepID=UPI00273E1952|nr:MULTISPECIES: hypothetical protein [unclassified Roseibium]
MGIMKVELGCMVSAQYAKRADFEHFSESTPVCQLKIGDDVMPVVQTGPLTFEIDHPSGYTCRFSIEEVLATLGKDLCEHSTGRQGKTYSDIRIDSPAGSQGDGIPSGPAARADLADKD